MNKEPVHPAIKQAVAGLGSLSFVYIMAKERREVIFPERMSTVCTLAADMVERKKFSPARPF